MKRTLFSILSILSLGFFLAGCSGKTGPSVQASFVVGKIGTSLPNGWTYIQAQSDLGEEISQAFPPNAPLNLILNSGLWSFSVLMWEGPEVMGGKLRCGAVDGFDVSGDSVTVAMTISSQLCLNDFVGPAHHDAAFGTHRLKLVGCQNLDGITTGKDECTNPLYLAGDSNSFRVILGRPTGTQIVSNCLNHAGLFKHKFIDRNFYSDLRIPVGGSRVVPLSIEGYRDENCVEMENKYDFPEGVARPENLTTANRFLTTNQIDHRLYFEADPYPTTTYSTAQSACTYKNIRYSYDVQTLDSCTCDASATGECTGTFGGGTNCPNPGDVSVGAQCAGDNKPICVSDHTNIGGPNCDAGSFGYEEIYCQVQYVNFICIVDSVDMSGTYFDSTSCDASGGTVIQHNDSANPTNYDAGLGPAAFTNAANCTKLFVESVTCNGEGATCQMGSTTPPNYNVLYIADNGIGYGSSALTAQVPDFSCSGGHCFPYYNPKDTYSGSSANKPINSVREALEEVIGASDGVQTYDYNNYNNTNGSSLPTVSKLYAYRDRYDYQDGGPRGGEIGDVQRDMAGILGALIARAGYTTCASIPTGGQSVPVSFEEDGIVKTYNLVMLPATKTIPTGYPDAGTAFEKRVEVYASGILEGMFEFRCSAPGSKAGYSAWKYDEGDYRGWTETYYHGDSNTNAIAHVKQYNESLFDSWVGKSVIGFKKLSVDKFNLYYSEVSESVSGSVSTLYRNHDAIGAFVDKATNKIVHNVLNGYLYEDPAIGESAYVDEYGIEATIHSPTDDSSDNGIKFNFVNGGTTGLTGIIQEIAFTDGTSTIADVIAAIEAEGYVVTRYDAPTSLLSDVLSAPSWNNGTMKNGRDPGFITGGMTFTPASNYVIAPAFTEIYSNDVFFTDDTTNQRTYFTKQNLGTKLLVQQTSGLPSDPGGNVFLDSGFVNNLGAYPAPAAVSLVKFPVADTSPFCEYCDISSSGTGVGYIYKIEAGFIYAYLTAGVFNNGESVDNTSTYGTPQSTIMAAPTPLEQGCFDLLTQDSLGNCSGTITPTEPSVVPPFAGASYSPDWIAPNINWGTAPF